MTIADHIREETMEFATLKFVKKPLKKGNDASYIAEMTELSVKKSA